MTRRKIAKAIKRLTNVPQGKDFFRYAANKLTHGVYKISQSTKVAHPATVMLELTNHCNLHCITCAREYQYGQEMSLGHMNFEKFKYLIDQLYPYVDSIGLTGLGEPLLYEQLPEALAYIKSKNKGIITSISTNASLKNTPLLIEKIRQHTDTLQISMDGIGEVYEKVRKNGNFKLFCQNLEKISELCQESDTDLMINLVLVKENFHQMTDILHFANEMKIRFVNFTLFNLASVTGLQNDYYQLYHSPVFQELFQKTIMESRKFKEMEFTYWDYKTESGFRKCPFPWTHFYITWDGYLVPCCAKPFPKELHFGNVFEMPLMDCLNSKAFQDFRRLWYKNLSPRFCKNCHFTDLKEFSL